MDKEDNPYMSLLGIMRKQGEVNNPVPFVIGTVITASPFLVQVGEIQLEREDVLINDFLLEGYKRKLKLDQTNVIGQTSTTSGGSGEASFASHAHSLSGIQISEGAYTTIEDDFKDGDKLLMLMSQDQQEFVVVCKVR